MFCILFLLSYWNNGNSQKLNDLYIKGPNINPLCKELLIPTPTTFIKVLSFLFALVYLYKYCQPSHCINLFQTANVFSLCYILFNCCYFWSIYMVYLSIIWYVTKASIVTTMATEFFASHLHLTFRSTAFEFLIWVFLYVLLMLTFAYPPPINLCCFSNLVIWSAYWQMHSHKKLFANHFALSLHPF